MTLTNKTVDELKKLAKTRKVKSPSTKNKKQLLSAIYKKNSSSTKRSSAKKTKRSSAKKTKRSSTKRSTTKKTKRSSTKRSSTKKTKRSSTKRSSSIKKIKRSIMKYSKCSGASKSSCSLDKDCSWRKSSKKGKRGSCATKANRSMKSRLYEQAENERINERLAQAARLTREGLGRTKSARESQMKRRSELLESVLKQRPNERTTDTNTRLKYPNYGALVEDLVKQKNALQKKRLIDAYSTLGY